MKKIIMLMLVLAFTVGLIGYFTPATEVKAWCVLGLGDTCPKKVETLVELTEKAKQPIKDLNAYRACVERQPSAWDAFWNCMKYK